MGEIPFNFLVRLYGVVEYEIFYALKKLSLAIELFIALTQDL